ncbi:MAG: glutaredoxin family protein [Dehalococcoidia bacterium]
MSSARTVTLYTRRDCHLCEEAGEMLAQLAGPMRFTLEAIDVDTDGALQARYGSSLPVVAVEDKVIAAAPLTQESLRASLSVAFGN